MVKKMPEHTSNSSFWDYAKNLVSCVNILMLQAISAVTVFVVWLAVQYNVSQSLMLHICLTTAGYGLLMTESIILFSGDNFFGKTISRYHKVLIHGVFIGMGSVLALAGCSIEINGKMGTEWPHFQSIHAITGLASMILMMLACLGGVAAAHMQRISKYVTCIRPVWWKICHNFIGQAAFAVGMCSLCYGFDTWWFNAFATWAQRVACVCVCATVTIWTLVRPMFSLLCYLKSAVSS